jgi:hypothetical protein
MSMWNDAQTFKAIFVEFAYLCKYEECDIILIKTKEIINMSKTSSAVKNRYNDKAYDRINLTVPKGDKDKIKAHADKYDGGSVNGFIQRAIREAIERDSNK